MFKQHLRAVWSHFAVVSGLLGGRKISQVLLGDEILRLFAHFLRSWPILFGKIISVINREVQTVANPLRT